MDTAVLGRRTSAAVIGVSKTDRVAATAFLRVQRAVGI